MVPAGVQPCTLTVMVNGPAARLPPAIRAPAAVAASSMPRAKAVTQPASPSGRLSATSAQAGVAAMAARSERLAIRQR